MAILITEPKGEFFDALIEKLFSESEEDIRVLASQKFHSPFPLSIFDYSDDHSRLPAHALKNVQTVVIGGRSSLEDIVFEITSGAFKPKRLFIVADRNVSGLPQVLFDKCQVGQVIVSKSKPCTDKNINDFFETLVFSAQGKDFHFQESKAEHKSKVKKEEILERVQFIPSEMESVFDFFSKAENLELITPRSLKFKILDKSDERVKAGTIINYRLSLYGVPLKWRTRICDFVENSKFIDEQVNGPYSKWVHTHEFKKARNGVVMKDVVRYKLPFGSLGKLLALPFVKRNLEKIFDYRHNIIRQRFG